MLKMIIDFFFYKMILDYVFSFNLLYSYFRKIVEIEIVCCRLVVILIYWLQGEHMVHLQVLYKH